MKNRKVFIYIVIGLAFVLTIGNIFLYVKTKDMQQIINQSSVYYNKPYLSKIDSLQKKNINLNLSIIKHEHKIAELTNSIDSLKHIKNNNKIKYVKKYKEINNAYANDLINQLQGIFTENGIN